MDHLPCSAFLYYKLTSCNFSVLSLLWVTSSVHQISNDVPVWCEWQLLSCSCEDIPSPLAQIWTFIIKCSHNPNPQAEDNPSEWCTSTNTDCHVLCCLWSTSPSLPLPPSSVCCLFRCSSFFCIALMYFWFFHIVFFSISLNFCILFF